MNEAQKARKELLCSGYAFDDEIAEKMAVAVDKVQELELQIGELEHKLEHQPDEILKYWSEGFEKHGFHLHRGLTPEQNAAEWGAKANEKDRLNGELRESLAEMVQAVNGYDHDDKYREELKDAEKLLRETEKRSVSSPICRVQTNCHGGTCGNLLPCDAHPGQSW